MAKNIYVGGNISIPGGEITTFIDITADNISDYFTISNSSYYFAGSGSTFTSNNKGIHSSTAQTILTAKVAINNFRISYGVSSETNYDKFTFTAKGTTVANAISGSSSISDYSVGDLAVGDQLSFKYTKDSSASSGSDTAWFQKMSFTITTATEPVEKTNVALAGKKIYVGVNGIARKAKKAYIGVNGVARMFWDKSFPWVGWSNATWEDIYNLCKAKQSGEIDDWPSDVVLGATKTVNLSTSVLGKTSYVMRIIGLDIDGDGVITFHSDTLSSTTIRGYLVCPVSGMSGDYGICGWSDYDGNSPDDFYNACEAKPYIKKIK